MARIFLSHSSRDNAYALALRDWLIAEGWDDLFLDLDPERGIAAGERWERALNEAALRCEAVLFLVSRAWLASGWCLKEFRLAGKLNKRMFGLLVDGLTIADLPPEIAQDWQVVDLASGRDHVTFRAVTPNGGVEEHVTFSQSGLARLRAGLNRAGLDAKFFAWPPASDPDRPPYRGLKALEAEDAGIFFGREAPTIAALDRLRGLREAAAPRFLAILGASGAGKSSFLRAGLLPRLARDDRHFLPLPVIRPERAALSGETGFARALTQACAEAKLGLTRAQIQAALAGGAATLLPLLEKLAEARRVPALPGEPATEAPALVLPIDQGEELFLAEGAAEAQAFLALLKDLANAATPKLIVLVAIRSDAYERLQAAPALEGVRQETLSLPPLPRGAYESVIEGPARRLAGSKRALVIEPALTQALLADIETGGAKDALPLLAFTLERLYVDHGGDGDLTLAEYAETGGVKGSIEAAVERAMQDADSDPRVPRDRAARLALLRRALIPWLAGIDPETGAPRRRVARLAEIPEEARPLVDCLVAARLLATDVAEGGAVTIEPAHEALLRQWGLLQGWLEEDFAALAALDGVKRSARDWEANARDAGWLAHAAGRLEDAERFGALPGLRDYLDAGDRDYLAACRVREKELRERELAEARRLAEAQANVVRRTRMGLIAASVLALLAGGAAWFGFEQAGIAEAQTAEANAQRAEAEQQSRVVATQSVEATKQATLARQQEQIASEQTKKAEQRSALLATNVAQKLLEEGSSDAALLLLLDAAQWFDDVSAPDELRIALSLALTKRQNMTIRKIFPRMMTFEVGATLLIVNEETKDIFKIENSSEPIRIHQGSNSESPIKKIGASPQMTELILVRENLDVSRLRLSDGSIRTIASLANAKVKIDPRFNEDPDIDINEFGFLTRKIYLPKDSERSDVFMQVLDLISEQLVDGVAPTGELIFGRGVRNEVIAFDRGESKLFEINFDRGTFKARPIRFDRNRNIDLQYGKCIASMNAATRKAALKHLGDTIRMPNGFECVRFGKNYLITSISRGSAGEFRNEKLLVPNDPKEPSEIDIKKQIRDVAEVAPTGQFIWVGGSNFGSAYAAIANRKIYSVADDELQLEHRHPTQPRVARFIGKDELIVVEPDNGQITTFSVKERGYDRNMFHSFSKLRFATPDHVTQTLHRGTCVGYSILRDERYVLSDGRPISLETDPRNKMTIGLSPNEINIDIPDEGRCVQFSPDWKRLLMVKSNGVSIFDFERVLIDQSLSNAKLAELTIPHPTAAFWVRDTYSIITSNWENRVHIWTQDSESNLFRKADIYVGDHAVIYAEPDAKGERLLIVEHRTNGDAHGFLYSLNAKQRWYDLGETYKWLGVAFTQGQEIVVYKHNKLVDVFPIVELSDLLTLAEKKLSPFCSPKIEKKYRSSECWPGAY